MRSPSRASAERLHAKQPIDATTAFGLADLRGKIAAPLFDLPDDLRLKVAQEICYQAVRAFWAGLCQRARIDQRLRHNACLNTTGARPSVDFYGNLCSAIDLLTGGFHLGELYTALLPDSYRARLGVFYTAPELASDLIDRLEVYGADWSTAKVLDPACGGAAFLGHVVSRVLEETPGNALARLRAVEERIVGLEIDPFAAWISQVVIDALALPFTKKAGRVLEPIVKEMDALHFDSLRKTFFDVVVGNPPFGKINLTNDLRTRYSRGLFGHANMYGLFLQLGVELTRPGGHIGYVLPTSFLAGEYFKNLRRLLEVDAPLAEAAFISERTGVFSDVLQETMLGIFRRAEHVPAARQVPKTRRVSVRALHPHGSREIEPEIIGDVEFREPRGAPWLLPRRRDEVLLVKRLNRMTSRLSDYGYRVATGQLVWNRHKRQLRRDPGDRCHPVVWAESISMDGTFNFPPRHFRHAPFIEVAEDQRFLVNFEPCVLVQRTTSKEQSRRLMATVVPNEFVVSYPGYVVENHVNMIVPTRTRPAVPLFALCELLNSPIADQAFRCISGSVAVSAYELEALPLPSPEEIVPMFRMNKAERFASLLDRLYYAA